MSNPDSLSYTLVSDDAVDTFTTQELRQGLEKGSDDVKLETLRRIVIATLQGNPQVSAIRFARGEEFEMKNKKGERRGRAIGPRPCEGEQRQAEERTHSLGRDRLESVERVWARQREGNKLEIWTRDE